MKLPEDASAELWGAEATPRQALLRGVAVVLSTPGLVLFATSTGFGALARDLGITFGEAMFMSGVIYALPAQVLLVDQMARGAAVATIALAVTLTAVRLLPMTVTLLPLIRDERGLRPVHWFAAHFMAITVWIEGSRRLPLVPPRLRLAHFFGIGGGMFCSTGLGTAVGYGMSVLLSNAVMAALLFMTPAYFLLSLLAGAQRRADWAAIGLGLVLAPLLFLLVPGPDLMLTGLGGGTCAYLIGRRNR